MPERVKEKYPWVRAISTAYTGMKRYRRSQRKSFGQMGAEARAGAERWRERKKDAFKGL